MDRQESSVTYLALQIVKERNMHYILHTTVREDILFSYRVIIQGRKEAQEKNNILSNNRFLDQPKFF